MRRLTIMMLAFSCACVNTPAAGPQYDADACSDFVVLQQLGLGWDRLNHRMSEWSVGFDREGCRAQSAEVTHIGGDFSTGAMASDAPSVDFGWQGTTTKPSDVGVARVSIEATLDGEPRMSVEQRLSRAALGLRHYRQVVALIDGVHYKTGVEQDGDYPEDYDASHGYTVRGFGAGASVVSLSDEDLVVRADFHLQTANSPDRPRLNAAIPHARIGARIDVLLVGIGSAAVHEGVVEYEMVYPEPVPIMDQEIPPPALEKTQVTLAGTAGAPEGFWGIASFDFAYRFDGTCAQTNPDCAFFAGETCESDGYCSIGRERPGEYMREISVGLDLLNYDSATGDAEFKFEGYTSNASNFVANFALDYEFRGEMRWIQATGATAPQRRAETFETGSTSYRLD